MQATKERKRRYKSNTFGRLPADMLISLFSQLTIQEIFSLKLTSFIHYKTINPLVSRKKKYEYGTYFQQRINQSLSPEHRTFFSGSLSWKPLVARENLYGSIEKNIKNGVIPYTKLGIEDSIKHYLYHREALDYEYSFSREGEGASKKFKLREIADIILKDDGEMFIKQGTRLYPLMSFLSINNPDKNELNQAYNDLRQATGQKFYASDFRFLHLLPEIINIGAIHCFNMSIRMLAGISFTLFNTISQITDCLDLDIPSLIIGLKIPYFIEQYLYLLTCIYPPGYEEIINIINIYQKQNLHEHVQNCMSRMTKEHSKAIGEHFGNYKEPLDSSNSISANPLQIVESQMEQFSLREDAIEELQSFLAYLQIDTPMDITTFTLKRNALNALLENIQDNLEVLDALEKGLSNAAGISGHL